MTIVFQSRDDYERVIKLLLHALDALADYADPNEVAAVTPWLDRAGEHARVEWTETELAHADRYRLDVTTRPGGRFSSPSLELRLVDDDAW